MFNLFTRKPSELDQRILDLVFLDRHASRSEDPEIVIAMYGRRETLADTINGASKYQVAMWTSRSCLAAKAAWTHKPVARTFLVPYTSVDALSAVHVSYLVNVLCLDEVRPATFVLDVARVLEARSRIFVGDQVVQPMQTEVRSRYCAPGTVWRVVPELDRTELTYEL